MSFRVRGKLRKMDLTIKKFKHLRFVYEILFVLLSYNGFLAMGVKLGMGFGFSGLFLRRSEFILCFMPLLFTFLK